MTKLKGKPVAMDTETHLIEPGILAPEMVAVGIYDDASAGGVKLYHANPKFRDGTREALQEYWGNGNTKVGHNLAYDSAVCAAYDNSLWIPIFNAYKEGKCFDTAIGDRLAHIAAGWFKFRPTGGPPKFDLAAVSKRMLNTERTGKTAENGVDPWRLRYSELMDTAVSNWPEEARDYLYRDVLDTQKIAEIQVANLDRLVTWNLQAKAAFALHLMSCWGLRTDEAMVNRLGKQLLASQREGRKSLIENGLIRKGKGSRNMEAIRALVDRSYTDSKRPIPLTKGGKDGKNKKTSTDNDTLERSGHPLLLQLAEVGSADKLISTFLPTIQAGVHLPINPSYNILVESGRVSAYKPNVQQLPRKGGVRECFIPRRGYVFAGADYSVAELCSCAQITLRLFGKSKMADALREGKHLHLATAASIMRKPYAKVLELYSQGDSETAEMRQLAKVLNLGLYGGMGFKTFVSHAAGYGLSISLTESKRLRDLWFATYPEMGLYLKWISRLVRMGKYTSVHPITGFVRGNLGYSDGANHNIQHLTACGAKEALFQVAYECYTVPSSDLYGSRPVLFIHDEIIIESPESNASAAAFRLSKVMEESMATYLPDIPCKAEPLLMRRWYKSAEPKYNRRGELIPWEPKIKESNVYAH